jgi:hypothetical protein
LELKLLPVHEWDVLTIWSLITCYAVVVTNGGCGDSVILDVTGSWDLVFKIAIGFYLLGTVVYNAFASGERVFDWWTELDIRHSPEKHHRTGRGAPSEVISAVWLVF